MSPSHFYTTRFTYMIYHKWAELFSDVETEKKRTPSIPNQNDAHSVQLFQLLIIYNNLFQRGSAMQNNLVGLIENLLQPTWKAWPNLRQNKRRPVNCIMPIPGHHCSILSDRQSVYVSLAISGSICLNETNIPYPLQSEEFPSEFPISIR